MNPNLFDLNGVGFAEEGVNFLVEFAASSAFSVSFLCRLIVNELDLILLGQSCADCCSI
jgi:hypothetical protein